MLAFSYLVWGYVFCGGSIGGIRVLGDGGAGMRIRLFFFGEFSRFSWFRL